MPAKKNSTSGLTSTDVVAIIEACATHKVRKFKLDDMVIEFDLSTSVRDNVDKVHEVQVFSPELVAVESAKADLVDAVLDSEDYLEQLKITDPYEWERLVREDDANNG